MPLFKVTYTKTITREFTTTAEAADADEIYGRTEEEISAVVDGLLCSDEDTSYDVGDVEPAGDSGDHIHDDGEEYDLPATEGTDDDPHVHREIHPANMGDTQ